MAIEIKFYESIADEIKGKFRRVSHLLPQSRQKSGEYHEEIIRDTLRNFLPSRYSVHTGYLYAGEDMASRQVDIMVIDNNIPHSFYMKSGDFVIVRPEPVVSVIEVKTRLRKNDFKEAFENIISAKQTKQKATNLHHGMYGVIFGFEAPSTIGRLLHGWFSDMSYSKEQSETWPDAVFGFNQGLLLALNNGNPVLYAGRKCEQYYKILRRNNESDHAWQLAFIIAMIIAKAEDNSPYSIKNGSGSLNDINTGDIILSHDSYYPGMELLK